MAELTQEQLDILNLKKQGGIDTAEAKKNENVRQALLAIEATNKKAEQEKANARAIGDVSAESQRIFDLYGGTDTGTALKQQIMGAVNTQGNVGQISRAQFDATAGLNQNILGYNTGYSNEVKDLENQFNTWVAEAKYNKTVELANAEADRQKTEEQRQYSWNDWLKKNQITQGQKTPPEPKQPITANQIANSALENNIIGYDENNNFEPIYDRVAARKDAVTYLTGSGIDKSTYDAVMFMIGNQKSTPTEPITSPANTGNVAPTYQTQERQNVATKINMGLYTDEQAYALIKKYGL